MLCSVYPGYLITLWNNVGDWGYLQSLVQMPSVKSYGSNLFHIIANIFSHLCHKNMIHLPFELKKKDSYTPNRFIDQSFSEIIFSLLSLKESILVILEMYICPTYGSQAVSEWILSTLLSLVLLSRTDFFVDMSGQISSLLRQLSTKQWSGNKCSDVPTKIPTSSYAMDHWDW